MFNTASQMPAIAWEGFLPHLTTAAVEHVDELDKSGSFLRQEQKTPATLVWKAAAEPH